MEKIVQTAGRNALGEFAPDFAHYNDDVLFGENWNNQDVDLKIRSIITVVALMSSGITDSSLSYHLQNAKAHGVTQKEIAAVITHVAFYVGWPKGWAVFNLAKEVWSTEAVAGDSKSEHASSMIFPIGAPNDGYAQYFVGQSYLAPLSMEQVGIFNVTFEPGCRNNWHIHHADKGGGQILLCVGGRGYYQEWGKEAVEMKPGDCINISAGIKHWHGAAPDSWFSHLAIEVPGENGSNEWCESVDDEQYTKVIGRAMVVEQFVMAYKVEQDRIRAILPDGFESLRPVLRINAEIRENELYLEFNTPVAHGDKRGWLNIDHWQTPNTEISLKRDGASVTFNTDFLEITYTGVGIEGGCPAERDSDGCYYLKVEPILVPPEEITENKEFCDCAFKWKFDKNCARGVSIGGKTLPAIMSKPEKKYPREAFTAEAFASIPCEQMLGQYKVIFQRKK